MRDRGFSLALDFLSVLEALQGELLYAVLGKPWPAKSHPVQAHAGFMMRLMDKLEAPLVAFVICRKAKFKIYLTFSRAYFIFCSLSWLIGIFKCSNVQMFICHHAERLLPGINVASFRAANSFPAAASQISSFLPLRNSIFNLNKSN